MASSNAIENTSQNKTCGCAEGDKNIWTTKTSENSDQQPQKCPNCQILKSGTLFLSSKGIGWTSWKKRWFVLTRTSLVFYRSDPNALPQKGNEANPSLGGIDLNNSGSVVVKADKKLLTVLFPDGRDGRTFTLKAETSEELQEWKTALENALTQAPSAALVTSQSGILRNETADSVEASLEQLAEKDEQPVNSMVIGRPVLLALEEIDGSPSFLEKALRFIEDYGIKVEGILRQSADVEEVKRRVQEYEQGKDEFSSDEDAHVIGDCIKYVLRELPSSPVPASCCTALVEAYRTGRTNRLNAICSTISEFPEPNCRLLQRVLKMMRTVACHKVDNRMSLSALAACMAPLLLRPLLAGDCEVEDALDMSGDGSIQLLKAAAAANHAQAIIIILLEDYDRIFDDDSLSSEIYTESEELEEDEEEDGDYDDDDEDDFSTDNDILEGNGSQYSENGLEADIDDDFEGSSSGSGTLSRSISDVGGIMSDDKSTEDQSTDSLSPRDTDVVEATERHSSSMHSSTLGKDMTENLSTNSTITPNADLKDNVLPKENANPTSLPSQEDKFIGDVGTPAGPLPKSGRHNKPTSTAKCPDISIESMSSTRRTTRLGRIPTKKNIPMGSTDISSDDEVAIQSLETAKNDLEAQLTMEVKGNVLLQASVERRKETLHERRSTLEKEVERLQELLQKERDLRAALESGLTNVQSGQLPLSCTMNSKTRADLEEINLAEADIISLKKKVADLREQLNHHPLCESCTQCLYAVHQTEEKDQQKIAHSSSPLHQSINSLKKDDSLSQAENEDEDAKVRSQHSLSSRSIRHRKQKLSSKSQKRKMSRESSSIPCTEEPTAVIKNSASDVSTLRVENSMSREDHDNAKARTQDSHLSAAKPPSQNLLPHETPATVASDSSKKSTSRDENTKSGAETRNLKGQDQKSVTSADTQSSSKRPSTPSNTTNESSAISSHSHNPPSTEERPTLNHMSASKKSGAKDENVKETSLSLEKGEPSQKLQQSSAVINSTTVKSADLSEDATAGSNTASKMPLKSEETASSSSSSSSTALAKLTSRLNFLKERRLQLVSELQNLDSSRASGQDPPPRTSST